MTVVMGRPSTRHQMNQILVIIDKVAIIVPLRVRMETAYSRPIYAILKMIVVTIVTRLILYVAEGNIVLLKMNFSVKIMFVSKKVNFVMMRYSLIFSLSIIGFLACSMKDELEV